jgi:hypothetical protein
MNPRLVLPRDIGFTITQGGEQQQGDQLLDQIKALAVPFVDLREQGGNVSLAASLGITIIGGEGEAGRSVTIWGQHYDYDGNPTIQPEGAEQPPTTMPVDHPQLSHAFMTVYMATVQYNAALERAEQQAEGGPEGVSGGGVEGGAGSIEG